MVTVPVNYQAVTGGIQISPSRVKFKPAFPVSITGLILMIVNFHFVFFFFSKALWLSCTNVYQKYLHEANKTAFFVTCA